MQDLDGLLAAGELDWAPSHLVEPGSWVGHLPFAFWLVRVLRPDLFVELGTHTGNSYFGFCQALSALHPAARAYAVDTWEGDVHAGFYGEDVFAGVSAYNGEHYRAFSTLLRKPFDAARPYFAEGSIDLLHIDGMHSYEQVRHDFESWQPALSSRAVVLLHDTGVREHGFGVWRLWHELSARYPSFEFTHSHGLGVLGIGPSQAGPLQALFSASGDPAAEGRIRRRVSARGEALQHLLDLNTAKSRLRAQSGDAAAASSQKQAAEQALAAAQAAVAGREAAVERLEASLAELQARVREQDAEAREQRERLAALEDAADQARSDAEAQRAAVQARDAEISTLRQAMLEAERTLDLHIGEVAARHEAERMEAASALKRLHDELDAAVGHQRHLVQTYVTSTSWRVTEPLRAASRIARGRPAPLTLPPPAPRPPLVLAPPAPPPPRPRTAALPDRAALPALKGATRAVLRLRLDAFLANGARLRFPPPEQPSLSIVLVLYNQAELTLSCLASIAETTEPADGIQLVIVDNASTDLTRALLDRVEGATILRNPDNRHFLRAMNQGAAAANGMALLLLNNDAQLLPGSVAAALRTLRSSPGIGAVGGRIILPDGTLQEAGSIIWQNGACAGYGRGADPSAPEYGFQRDVDFCSGAFLLTWTALWRQLGGFDERYAPAYYEETDYCVRLWKAGFRVVFDPDAAIVHFEFGSSVQSGDALALQAANHDVFRKRHSGWLLDQRPIEAGPLAARTARTTTPRVLVLDGAAAGADLPLAALLDRGALVTLLAVGAGPGRPAGLDRRVETAPAADKTAALHYLASRPGYYGAIVLGPALAALRAELAVDPGLTGDAIILEAAGLAAFVAAMAGDIVDPADALPASRPAETDAAMAVPFGFAPLAAPAPRVAVICHLFYPDVAAELLSYLANIPGEADLYVSTDTEEKRALLLQSVRGWDRGSVDLRVMPNRGRDIAPKLVGFASAHAGYDLVLHVHSKRSDHSPFLAPWRSFLFETLLGSPAIVTSIMDAFARLPRLGMLAPLHFEAIRRWIGWNGNLAQARALATRMGVTLQPGRAVDFPSGSMFWARPAALYPLLDLRLGFEDFPDEGDQKDHTAAHAIERLFFYGCEKSGHDWLKIADPALFHDPSAIVPIETADALHAFATSHRVRLTGPDPIAVRPDPAPMQTEVAPGLAARLAARLAAPLAAPLAARVRPG